MAIGFEHGAAYDVKAKKEAFNPLDPAWFVPAADIGQYSPAETLFGGEPRILRPAQFQLRRVQSTGRENRAARQPLGQFGEAVNDLAGAGAPQPLFLVRHGVYHRAFLAQHILERQPQGTVDPGILSMK